jgi:hypothetical protein
MQRSDRIAALTAAAAKAPGEIAPAADQPF